MNVKNLINLLEKHPNAKVAFFDDNADGHLKTSSFSNSLCLPSAISLNSQEKVIRDKKLIFESSGCGDCSFRSLLFIP